MTAPNLADRVIQALEDNGRVLLPTIRQLMREAWDEGHKQGGPMADVNYDDPGASQRNPYEPEETPRKAAGLDALATDRRHSGESSDRARRARGSGS